MEAGRLRVDSGVVEVAGRGAVVTAPVAHGGRLAERLRDLRRARRLAGTGVVARSAAPVGEALHAAGEELARSYAPGPAGEALRELVEAGDLLLEVRADEDLPWEALVVPGTGRPLGLHPNVRMYRSAPGGAYTTGTRSGPLRILAAGDLERLLDVVEPGANLRILDREVAGEPVHVVHLDDAEWLPDGNRPGLVVVAGRGRVAELLAAGVPQILALTEPVTDGYVARFLGHFYQLLAGFPSVPGAVAGARRLAGGTEWTAPVLYCRGAPAPLHGVTVADMDEPEGFVGRRDDLRTLLEAARRPGHAGVVLHGLGGMGRGSLATELVRRLGDEAGLVVRVSGTDTGEQILDTFGRLLAGEPSASGTAAEDRRRRLAAYLRTPEEFWRDRLATAFAVLGSRPVTLIVDDFAIDPRARRAGHRAEPADPGLAAFLGRWIREPGPHRVVITSRLPFTLPGNLHKRLTEHHLGPLSEAEARVLGSRLPALAGLTPAEQHRAWAGTGGHPRTLEHLDALLRRSPAGFAEVAGRLEALLARQGVPDPGRWASDLRSASDDDRRAGLALAEAIATTVNDAVLSDLLALLDDDCRRLLVGAAVYRRPADEPALVRQSALPGLPDGLDTLAGLGLVSEVTDEEGVRHTVHPWTAASIARLHPSDTAAAHGRAADYYRHRVRPRDSDPVADLDDLIEARHHLFKAGRVDEAIRLSFLVRERLDMWSAWDWARAVCEETLGWVEPAGRDAATLLHYLGLLAHRRGETAEAERLLDRSLSVAETAGDRTQQATICHKLSRLAEDRGDHAAAERRLRQALLLDAENGNRTGLATGQHRLAQLCTLTNRLTEAVALHCQALAIEIALGLPDARLEVADLARLRAALGEEDFRRAVTAVLPEESVSGLARLLDDFATAAESRQN
ncbi:tetratricopeptide repeat protein [Paractinoplanes atraurantiacus]|uniref:AAA ATPase domain-containing protein n=1 Tax=Paractinoplanes atraurantiacus TaxID=1036182 RepID=A0A285KKT1_9ACTN|nr:tetratricopeptide repeat protein [Actinoplanes atraurantiacus]SNY71881.1 AAA ATPase domain-containing protein [Actinoplanes atraurantiacus]